MIPTHLARISDPRLRAIRAGHQVWTTLEGENPGGSIKDRMVLDELSLAMAKGDLHVGDLVSEISAGSTALSLAFHARKRGLACELFVPLGLDPLLRERLLSLEVRLHHVEPATAYTEYEEHCRRFPRWRLDQMGRSGLESHYKVWADRDLRPRVGGVDWVVGAVGTGHSLLGVGDGLGPRQGLCSAEPMAPRSVVGIRNLDLESFGEKDPCSRSRLHRRLELSSEAFMAGNALQTDLGEVFVSDSFRVVLAAVERLAEEGPPMKFFAVGAANRRGL